MSKQYWINREKERLKKNLKDVEKTSKELDKHLESSRNQVEKEIYKLYIKYSQDNELSLGEAKTSLTSDEYKVWRMDIAQYMKEIEETGNPLLLEELNALAMRSRITRLEEMLYQIGKILNRDYEYKHEEVKELLEKGVTKNYEIVKMDITRLTGIKGSFATIDKKVVESIVTLPWTGKNYSDRLWKNKEKLEKALKKEITDSITMGKDLRDCVKVISEKMDQSKKVTKRLVNTEHAYACEQATFEAYKDMDVEKYEILATLDLKTSDICKHQDGKVYDLEKAKVGVNYPPFHPNCRTTTVPYLDDSYGDEERIARDEDGKNIYVPENMTYKEWYEKHIVKKFNFNPEELKYLKKIEYNEENKAIIRGVRTKRVANVPYKLYVSDEEKIKPIVIKRIHARILKVKKILDLKYEDFPKIAILDVNRMNNTSGAYNHFKNELAISSGIGVNDEEKLKIIQIDFVNPESKLSTIIHEFLHCKDNKPFYEKHGVLKDTATEEEQMKFIEIKNKYEEALNKRIKKILDNLGINEYNVGNISEYAKSSYLIGDFDETYTEYRTKEILKKEGK